MEKDYIKVYCKFDKAKQPIEEIICKIFQDYAKSEKNNNLYIRENNSNMLKQ